MFVTFKRKTKGTPNSMLERFSKQDEPPMSLTKWELDSSGSRAVQRF